MTTVSKPQARIALGWAVIKSERVPIQIDIEWDRFFDGLLSRAGGVSGDGFAEYLSFLTAAPVESPAAQDALRAVDELRQELASARSDTQRLVARVEELESQLAGARTPDDLRARVEQIEDRLQ